MRPALLLALVILTAGCGGEDAAEEEARPEAVDCSGLPERTGGMGAATGGPFCFSDLELADPDSVFACPSGPEVWNRAPAGEGTPELVPRITCERRREEPRACCYQRIFYPPAQ